MKLDKATVFVRNLDFDVNEEALMNLFEAFSPREALIVREKTSGQSRGFGFIKLGTLNDAIEAVKELNGSTLYGRNITVAVSGDEPQTLPAKEKRTIVARIMPTDRSVNVGPEHVELLLRWLENKYPDSKIVSHEIHGADKVFLVFSTHKAARNILSNHPISSGLISSKDGQASIDITFSPLKRDTSALEPEKTRTAFVRNVPVTATTSEISKALGPGIDEVKFVMNELTGRPSGSAFLIFRSSKDLEALLKKQKSLTDTSEGNEYDWRSKKKKKRFLEDDTDLITSQSGLKILGQRVVVFYVEKEEEIREKVEKVQNIERESEEKHRNLDLINEGIILSSDSRWGKMSEKEKALRLKAYRDRKKKLEDSRVRISRVKLAVRNLPKDLTREEVKTAFETKASSGVKRVDFAKVSSSRSGSSSSGRRRNTEITSIFGSTVLKKREKEKEEQELLDTIPGFAFVTYSTHELALKALRKANNSPRLFGPQNRPIIEFALENMEVVQRSREKRGRNIRERKSLKKRN